MSTALSEVEVIEAEPIIIEEDGDVVSDDTGRVKGTVAMSRALVNASHGLKLNEKRLMMCALRFIDSKKSPHAQGGSPGYVSVRVKADQFAAVADLQPRDGERQATSAYEGLKDACARLMERKLTYREGKRLVQLRWVFKAVYHDGEGWAEISFSPDLTPHIFMLRNRFVQYNLELARGLQSVYTWRLLELLMREKDRGKLFITVEDLRVALDIPETYRFADIKRRVIETAVGELNKKADLVIDWKPVKRGRAVASLEFTFVENPQRRLTDF
ncbi:Replication initiation protein [Cupriavidus campinensis]|nr:replication initiation protein [Cupriavidus campinensis]CAG2138213.1 Replication initiation protein [Cupriavidus campinensis]